MRRLLLTLFAWALLATGGPAWAQDLLARSVHTSEFSRAEVLVHAPQGVRPGQPLWLGLAIQHQPEWHAYWKTPATLGCPPNCNGNSAPV